MYDEKPWVKSYDSGIPESLAPYPDVSVFDLLEQAAEKYPTRDSSVMSASLPVVGRVSQAVTYRELNNLVDRLTAALQDRGVKKGDRVGIVLANSTQFVISFYAILKAGATVVALNPTFPPKKWAGQLNDADIRVAIVMSSFYEGINSVRAETPIEHIIVTNIKEFLPPLARLLFTLAREKKDGHYVESLKDGDAWLPDILKTYTAKQRKPVEIKPKEDSAIFQYTGGTTGLPKAARGPHSALVANTVQMRAWLASQGAETDSFLAAVPLFHVYGMVAVLNFAVSIGAPMYMVPNPRDIPDVLDVITTFKPTIFMGVPALYNAINNRDDLDKYDLSSIRGCISGSAPLAPETKRKFEQLTGGRLMEGFGMSEAPTATHCNPFQGE
ncbi:MAG: long-chain fatty acid--CoA ligase, partial [Chloroflexi bacterium]|nr:long-chain fatty acid--CoA ligase [Chloroflexota bacterium]